MTNDRFARLYDNKCSIAEIMAHHRKGDIGETEPYCETMINQETGDNEETQWKKIAEISSGETSYIIDSSITDNYSPNKPYYYILRAESGSQEGAYSSMLFSLKKEIYHFSDKKNFNWISMPYASGTYTKNGESHKIEYLSDIVKQIEGGVEVGTNKKIELISIWNPETQRGKSNFSYDAKRKTWISTLGDDNNGDPIEIPLNPGDGIYILGSNKSYNEQLNWIPYLILKPNDSQ